MPGDIDPYGFERLQLTNLADLDHLIADRFSLPPRPYSTDIRTDLRVSSDVGFSHWAYRWGDRPCSHQLLS